MWVDCANAKEVVVEPVNETDFRPYVEGGWSQVNAAVRQRIDRLLTSDTVTRFVGEGVVRRSPVGWFFAQLCRPLGAPLVWRRGEKVAMVVDIAPTPGGKRCWHRHYHFADGTRYLVQTAKIVHPQRGIMDAVGEEGQGRLNTKMHIWAEGKSLHFASEGYFLRFGQFYLPLPLWLTPGRFYAEHRDLGDGTFRYILRFEHSFWGERFIRTVYSPCCERNPLSKTTLYLSFDGMLVHYRRKQECLCKMHCS